ncbi:MAG: tyrosine-type recombinase/integrase [Bacteroidia bacterium]|nr:tyrosine-type recombinase/integrase [Bacteroidia bacterium]MDW8236221.1 tyrosine-type recombinase/integrase [Bacteroidia bacterium]
MLEQFLAYLRDIAKVSAHTLDAYKRDLEGWAAFCQQAYGFSPVENLESWQKVQSYQVRAWLSLYPRGTTRARKGAALRRMNTYIERVLRQKGWTHRLASPKLPPALPRALSERSLLPLIQGLESRAISFPEVRNLLVAELLYGCGLRRSEAANLRLGQVHLAAQELHILGKGSKWRIIPIYKPLLSLLQRYLALRKALQPDHDYLLCTDKGKPLYPQAIYRIVRGTLGTHPHALRHSFATHLLQRGAHVQAVKELLGHASLATTQRYLAITPAELKAAYQKCHPRA